MIDTKFVDIDFDNEVPDGIETCGLLAPPDDDKIMRAGVGDFADEYPQLMLTKQQRRELAKSRVDAYRADTLKIYSQSNSGACVGFGSAQAYETMHTRIYGIDNHVSMAGMWTYSGIGNSWGSGAYIPDGMADMVNNGVMPLATDENEDRGYATWALLNFDKTRPASSYKQADHFRVVKWSIARGPDAIESALSQGFCGIVGRSRHCVPYTHLDFDSSGSPFAAYANSWGANWGDGGFGFDSYRVYSGLSLYLIMEMTSQQALEKSGLPE